MRRGRCARPRRQGGYGEPAAGTRRERGVLRLAAPGRAAAAGGAAQSGNRGGTQVVGSRTVLVTAHTGKQTALRAARRVAERLTAADITVRTLAGEFSSPGA